MLTPTEQQISEMRARGAYEYTVKGHTFYLRKPNQGEYRAFSMATDGNQAKIFDACKTLTQACVLFPPLEELEAIFDDCPPIVKLVGLELLAIANKSEESEAKKL